MRERVEDRQRKREVVGEKEAGRKKSGLFMIYHYAHYLQLS